MTFLRQSRKCRGHNLLEMIFAVMIFATALVPMALVFQYIAMSTGKARTKLVGQYLAKGLIEKCIAAKYYNVTQLATIVNGAAGPMTYDPIELTFRKDGGVVTHLFYSEVEVSQATGAWVGGNVAGRVLRVRVSWEEKNRRTAATMPFCEYITYIGENS
jgi:hypothetical protein